MYTYNCLLLFFFLYDAILYDVYSDEWCGALVVRGCCVLCVIKLLLYSIEEMIFDMQKSEF